jgi:hypothetical protein
MLVTNKEIRIPNWREHGAVIVPAGAKVSRVSYGSEGKHIYFVEEFGKVFDPKTQVMQYHDAEYYGLSVDEADVSETHKNWKPWAMDDEVWPIYSPKACLKWIFRRVLTCLVSPPFRARKSISLSE